MGPTRGLELDRVWPCAELYGVVVVFVKKLVVGVAKVPGATLAELGSPLGTASFTFHAFLARDTEAADVSDFDLFTELEIWASIGISRSHWFRN